MATKPFRVIFVVGGVMSGVGKGVVSASLGNILQSSGVAVTLMKIDPYINVDAGTMNPVEHGEVFVTDDADETDQDIGTYERFIGRSLGRVNYMTTGRVYQSVIQRERNLEYNGKCVEVVPHVPEEVIARIERAAQHNKADIVIVEIGGTVGEYQNILFLEAARMMKLKNPEHVQFVLVSYLPIPRKLGEMKTKPTQYAARSLNAAGIQADYIVCRASVPIDEPRRRKLAQFCNVLPEAIISAPDVDNIYEIPLRFSLSGVGEQVLTRFGLRKKRHKNGPWEQMVVRAKRAKHIVRIGIVGKYFGTGNFTLSDSYLSVIEAIKFSAWAQNLKSEIIWLNAEAYEGRGAKMAVKELVRYDGLIVPGGFGGRGIEGKLRAIEIARTKRIPYFGLCYGMQLATIEFARNVLKLKGANTTEVDAKTPYPIIDIMPEQKTILAESNYGNTMRLGAYPCALVTGTKTAKAYGKKLISERHRHRYEFNNAYRAEFELHGMRFAGLSPNGKLVEIIELPKHPFFVGTQFHPEFLARPLTPHPLFNAFIAAAKKRTRK